MREVVDDGRPDAVAAASSAAEDPVGALGSTFVGLLRTNMDASLAMWTAFAKAPSVGAAWLDQSRIVADTIQANAEQVRIVLDATGRVLDQTDHPSPDDIV